MIEEELYHQHDHDDHEHDGRRGDCGGRQHKFQ
jgi:hypothetical protein